jgi:hypothetical protein
MIADYLHVLLEQIADRPRVTAKITSLYFVEKAVINPSRLCKSTGPDAPRED